MHAETADIETSSAGYARRFDSRAGRWMLDLQEAIVRRWLPASPALNVLDVGGGHAQLARPLAALGHRVTVIGSDPVCQERLRPEVDDGRIRFVTGDLVQLPFPDASFDAVVCIRLLPHCDQWPRLIRELARVARERVVVDYPSRFSVNAVAEPLFALKKRVEGNTRPFRVFTHREVRGAFAGSGFSLERHKPQFFAPMVVHRMMNSPPFSSGLERAFAALGLTSLLGSPVLACFRRQPRAAPAGPPPPIGPVADED